MNNLIKEIDFGEMTGKTIVEIPKEIDIAYMRDPFIHRHVGGENMEDVFERVSKFLEEKIYTSGKEDTIIIVTHDNIIKAFIGVINNLTKEVMHFKISNCSITEYEIKNNEKRCIHCNLNYFLKENE